MRLNRLKSDELQFVAERKELEQYLDERIRTILKEEMPGLIDGALIKPWLTKEEVMEFTGWSSRTLQHLRDSNQISFSQHGRKILYPREGILDFLSRNLINEKSHV